tara:strand:- start:519 stop:698 length:180 start_codon:yes stop_codon:yes gene_type:complete
MINEVIVFFECIINQLGMGFSLSCRRTSFYITIIFNGLIFLGHRVENGMDFVEVTLGEC